MTGREGGGARVGELTVDELLGHLELVHLRPLAFTRAQVAVLLNVDRHHVGELVREGHLRTVPLGPGERYARIPREEVERLAREGIPAPKPRRRRSRKPANEDADVGDLSKLGDWTP